MGFVGKLEEIRARARQHIKTAATVKHGAKKAARRRSESAAISLAMFPSD